MRRNNKALYEKIMRNVSKEVKRTLNEVYNTDTDFYDISMEVYNNWVNSEGDNIIYKLEKRKKISRDMNDSDLEAEVLSQFDKLLNKAVGGDWWSKGLKAGYTEDELNSIYVDDMQAKVDCITDYKLSSEEQI